jgi:hypothetical protein
MTLDGIVVILIWWVALLTIVVVWRLTPRDTH